MDLSSIVQLVIGAAVVITFWRQGGNTASKEVIETYKTQVSQLKATIELLRKESHDIQMTMNEKLGNLQGQIDEKDKTIKTMTAIFQDRNPESITFMEEMKKIGQAAVFYMEKNSPLIEEIHTSLIKKGTTL